MTLWTIEVKSDGTVALEVAPCLRPEVERSWERLATDHFNSCDKNPYEM